MHGANRSVKCGFNHMKPISSLPEAFACLQNLQAFLEGMMGTRCHGSAVTPRRNSPPKIKAVDRVLTLMRELNRPLSPTEIAAEPDRLPRTHPAWLIPER